jgi:hypothetical protein
MLRSVLTVVAFVVWCGFSPDAQATYRPRLMGAGAPATAPEFFGARLLDAGGGGDVTSAEYATQGCLSLAGGLGVSVLVGGVASAVFIAVAGLTDLSSAASVERLLNFGLGLSLGLALLVPVVTSGIVSFLAAKSGASPNYLAVLGASAAVRLLFAVIGLFAPQIAVPLGVAGLLLPPVAEVYVANFVAQGAGGDTGRRTMIEAVSAVHRPARAEADRPGRSDRAATGTLFAASF